MDFNELTQSRPETARRLLGSDLVLEQGASTYTCTIAETEFYHQDDPASHTYKGQTNRNKSMFLSAGHVYVYFIYGMHYCLNIVCGSTGEGCGVLVRGGIVNKQRIDGPARLTRRLGIDRTFDGHDLSQAPLQLHLKPPVPYKNIQTTPRIGISKATEKPWRYILLT